MKKKILALFALVMTLVLSGCKSSRERQFNRFLNSKGVDLTLSLNVEAQGAKVNIEILSLISYRELMSITFANSENRIITDLKENKQYYDSKTSGKIVTDYEIEKEQTATSYYISDIYVENDRLYFSINAKELLDSAEIEEAVSLTTDKIKCRVDFIDNRVSSMYIDLLSYIDIDVDPSIKMGIEIEVNEYGRKVEKPKIDKDEYKYVDRESFIEKYTTETIEEMFSSLLGTNNNSTQIPEKEINPDNCNLYVSQTKFTFYKGDSNGVKLVGHLNWNDGGHVQTSIDNIKLEKDIDFNKPGYYCSKAICEYGGYTFKTDYDIEILIIDPVEKTNVHFNFSDNIINAFPYDENHMLICDSNTIYKYNVLTGTCDGQVDVKYEVNDIKIKEEYLYVLSNSTNDLELNDYDSALTKIKLEDFSLVTQKNFKNLGDNFFVDIRDDIIVSQQINQNFKFVIINLEEDTLEELYSCYEDDYLVYKKEKDAFLVVSPTSSQGNYWIEYTDGKYVENKVESSNVVKNFLAVDSDNNIFVKKYSDGFTHIDKYDTNKKDYVSYRLRIGSKLTYEFNYNFVYVVDDKIYSCYSRKNLTQIIEYNTSTRISRYIVVELEPEISFMEVINNKIYLFEKNSNNATIVEFEA